MEIKTSGNIEGIAELLYNKDDFEQLKVFQKKKWVAVEDLKKRLFDSDIPVIHSQKLIEELE